MPSSHVCAVRRDLLPDPGPGSRVPASSQRQPRLRVERPASRRRAGRACGSRRRRSSRRCRSRARAAARTPGCRRGAARFGVGAQAAVGRTPPADPDAARAEPARRLERAIEQRVDDDALEAGADVGDLRRRQRGAGAVRVRGAAAADRSPVRSRTSRSTAVFSPLKLKSTRRATSGGSTPSPVGRGALRSACVSRAAGKSKARSLPSRASAIDHRPARIPEPEQLRHLVVRLPRRIVAGPADQPVATRLGDRGRGWCARRRRPAPRPAAAARRARGPATRCGRRGDAPERPGCPAPTRTPWRTPRRRAASRRDPGPASPRPRRSRPATPCACSSAASTTPQMSRTCWREASSGTTPPHSRWIAACDATTFERIAQGRAASPVSATTAAAVSSHEVSIASRFIHGGRAPRSRASSDSVYGGPKMPRSVMMPVM